MWVLIKKDEDSMLLVYVDRSDWLEVTRVSDLSHSLILVDRESSAKTCLYTGPYETCQAIIINISLYLEAYKEMCAVIIDEPFGKEVKRLKDQFKIAHQLE